MRITNKSLLKVLVWILLKSKKDKVGHLIITGFKNGKIQFISKPFTGWYEAESINIDIPTMRIHF